MHRYRVLAATAALTAGLAVSAPAQSLGTFTWQLQPFCNRLTVNVTQSGGLYTLDGFDDQCGAPQRAPLVGLATPNPDGTIGFGFHIATSPGGKTVSVEARISLATIGGPWTDSAGNSGTLVLNGSAAGSARPAPAAGPAWGTTMAAPSTAAGTGLVLRTASAGLLEPPPALMVESTPPTGVTLTGATGVAANVTRGAAVTGYSASDIGVMGASGGSRPGGAGVMAVGAGRAFALRAISNNALPAIYASGGTTAAISAEAGTDGSAVELFNGGITVSGTTRPAFVHTATVGNVVGARTVLDHPLLNNRFNAIATANYLYTGSVGFLAGGVALFYDSTAGRWSIMRSDGSAMPAGARFNVIVFNQ
jgi:hypothetical protein